MSNSFLDYKSPYAMIFKVVLIGDVNTGKTNILTRFIENEFIKDSKSTIGVEFNFADFEIEGKKIRAQIWDTAGQERFKAITNAHYKGAMGAFIVYDITRKETFEHIDKWLKELKEIAEKDIVIILIGNKNDLEKEREVNKEDAKFKATQYNIAFLETSALNGNNIEKAFNLLINEIYNIVKKDNKTQLKTEISQGYNLFLKNLIDYNRTNKKNSKLCC